MRSGAQVKTLAPCLDVHFPRLVVTFRINSSVFHLSREMAFSETLSININCIKNKNMIIPHKKRTVMLCNYGIIKYPQTWPLLDLEQFIGRRNASKFLTTPE